MVVVKDVDENIVVFAYGDKIKIVSTGGSMTRNAKAPELYLMTERRLKDAWVVNASDLNGEAAVRLDRSARDLHDAGCPRQDSNLRRTV